MSEYIINLPDAINGIEGVGIAVGVDDLKAEAIHLVFKDRVYVPPVPFAGITAATAEQKVTFAKYESQFDATRALLQSAINDGDKNDPYVQLHDKGMQADDPNLIMQHFAHTTNQEYVYGQGEVCAQATLAANACPYSDATAASAWYTGIAYIVSNGLHPKDSSYFDYCAKGQYVVYDDARPFNHAFLNVQHIANLIAAGKVNWYKMNHHVGTDQQGVSGYVAKVAKSTSWYSHGDSAQLCSAVWHLCKLASTPSYLTALGIKGINGAHRDNAVKKFTFKLSDDVIKRIQSNPAGTSKLYSALAAVDAMKVSPYSIFVPNLTDHSDCVKEAADIKDNPIAYHPGAQYLTGVQQLAVTGFTEDSRMHIAAFVHATQGSSTLAQSPGLIGKADVSSHVTYTQITRAKVAIGKAGSSVVMSELLKAAGIRDEPGGMAKELGLLSEEAIAEAKIKARAIEAKVDEK